MVLSSVQAVEYEPLIADEVLAQALVVKFGCGVSAVCGLEQSDDMLAARAAIDRSGASVRSGSGEADGSGQVVHTCHSLGV